MITTNGTYPWTFVTQISHNHDDDRTMFEVMTKSCRSFRDNNNPL